MFFNLRAGGEFGIRSDGTLDTVDIKVMVGITDLISEIARVGGSRTHIVLP